MDTTQYKYAWCPECEDVNSIKEDHFPAEEHRFECVRISCANCGKEVSSFYLEN